VPTVAKTSHPTDPETIGPQHAGRCLGGNWSGNACQGGCLGSRAPQTGSSRASSSRARCARPPKPRLDLFLRPPVGGLLTAAVAAASEPRRDGRGGWWQLAKLRTMTCRPCRLRINRGRETNARCRQKAQQQIWLGCLTAKTSRHKRQPPAPRSRNGLRPALRRLARDPGSVAELGMSSPFSGRLTTSFQGLRCVGGAATPRAHFFPRLAHPARAGASAVASWRPDRRHGCGGPAGFLPMCWP
jgi:hypothetical protein